MKPELLWHIHLLAAHICEYIFILHSYQSYQSSLNCLSSWRNLGKGSRMKNTAPKFRMQDLVYVLFSVYAEREHPPLRLILLGHFMQIQNLYFQGSLSFVNQWALVLLNTLDTVQVFVWQCLSYQHHLLPGPNMSHICIPCYPREQHRIRTGNQNQISPLLL